MEFKAYTAGLPDSAVKLISESLTEAYDSEVEVRILDVNREMVAIRQAAEDDTVVLVCFDSVASSRVEDFENGLFDSEKYHKYSSKKTLTEFLNTEYELELPVPEETQEVPISTSSGEFSELGYSEDEEDLDELGYLDTSSADRVSVDLEEKKPTGDSALIIENLMAENAELRSRDDEYGSTESAHDPELDNKIFQLETTVRTLENDNKILDSKVSHYEQQTQKYRDSATRLKSKLTALQKESDKRERALTAQSGQLRENERELESLRSVKRTLESVRTELDHTNTSLTKAKEEAVTLRSQLSSKEDEVNSLASELDKVDSSEERISILNEKVEKLDAELIKERARTKEKVDEIIELQGELEGTGSLDDEVDDLKRKLDSASNYNSELNATILELQEELTDKKLDEEDHHEDPDSLNVQNRLLEFESSILGKLSETSLPGSTPASIELGSLQFKNIIFVFSGSMDSTIDGYRQLKNLTNSFDAQGLRGLIADFSNESFIDYVMQVNPKRGLVNWLENGGSIQKIATPISKSKHTEVVSLVSEGFVNDLYMLQVDWGKRLKELNESGYKVVAYMGSLSTLIGRVLYSTLLGRGNTRIYTKGNLGNVRTLYQNLSGLPHSKRTRLYFYDLIPISKVTGIVKKLKDSDYNVNIVSKIERGGGLA